LSRWQSGDLGAKKEMVEVFDAAISGEFDDNFSVLVPANEIHATASVENGGAILGHGSGGVVRSRAA
jgi:hypothetical protein